MTLIPAACYIRVSTEDQTEYSPDAQRRALERYAARQGMTILPDHVYVDPGLSGRRAATRPAFQAMIAAAKGKPSPFQVILVHKFDRFARNREDSIVYKSMLRRQCGVQVISITESLEDDRMSLILEAMLEAMAEYYSINLADEVRKGMTEKARRGELQTAPAFGYTVRENRLVPLPEEAALVSEIFTKFLSGSSLVDIARWTQRRGILTHRSNPMDARQVRYILSNPVYLGLLRWQPKGAEGPPLTVPGGHPPLVSQGVFEEAQGLLSVNAARHGKHARPAGERKHWLAGLVTCAACGGRLIFSAPHYMKCGRYVKGRCAVSQHTPVEGLEAAVLGQLRRDAATDRPFSIRLAQRSNPADTHRQELAAIEKKLHRLREAYLCGAESPEEYKAAKAALTDQAEALRQAMDPGEEGDGELTERVTRALGTLEDPAASLEARYRAASAVFSACIWSKEDKKLTLVYRFAW